MKYSFLRSTDIPYSWSCYETLDEIQALLHCLSYKEVRERALKRSLKEQMESIAEGIRWFVKLYIAYYDCHLQGLYDSLAITQQQHDFLDLLRGNSSEHWRSSAGVNILELIA